MPKVVAAVLLLFIATPSPAQLRRPFALEEATIARIRPM